MNRIILNETSYFGAGCRSVIAVEAARRGFKKAFFVTDKDLVKFGVAAEIIKVFDDNKIPYELYSDVKANPTIANVQNGVAAYKASGADFIVALGGGSSIDTAKGLGIVVNNPDFAYIAGMGFSNVGLGIVHSMAHPLGAFYDTPHGVANALLLPYVMEYNAESPAAPKYINIAKAMGVETAGMSEAEGVKAAIEAVKSLSLSIGIPQKLHEINVKEEDIPALAVAAFNDVCTGGNPRPTSVEDIEVLYRKAF